jgi:hypothetical protein
MKKSLLYGLALLMAAGLSLNSCKKAEQVTPPEENLAPTAAQNRVAVIEDFTGVRCPWCPGGAMVSKALEEQYPGKVLTIAIHSSGGYSMPGDDGKGHIYPDFQTQWGLALNSQAGIAGYPAGTVNRHKFEGGANSLPYMPQKTGGMALNRENYQQPGTGGWYAAVPAINAMPAPVNLGMKTSWDAGSRTLTVTAETYYTADQTGPNNLNIALCENGVIGLQANNYTGTYQADYVHNHMLRHLLTGQWGEPIEKTTTGSRNKKTVTYVVPENIKIENCDVVAFVTQDRVEVLNALKVKAN